MDQPVRSNQPDEERAEARSRARTARTLVRGGAIVAALALIVVVWSVLSAHRASAQLKEATEAQSVVTVATTNPQPLTFIRHSIIVELISGDDAVLKEGPEVGMMVATTGAPQLYGAEKGVGH